jgi:hypothetical protein
MSVCTCHTEGCDNAGEPIELTLSYPDAETGETVYVSSVVCGVCGQEITDVDPPLPGTDPAPDPPEIDNTLPGVES